MPGNLSPNITVLSTGTTGTSGNLKGQVIDTKDIEGVIILGFTPTTNASTWIKIRMATDSATGNMSDATGEVLATLRTLYLDVHRPAKRFVQGVFKGATTTGSYRTLTTITYGHRNLPTTYDASATGLRVYSPGSGTATG